MRSEKWAKFLKRPITSTLIAILCGFVVACIVLALSGFNAIDAMNALGSGIFGKPKYMLDVLMKSTPIIITGISVAFAFRTGLFNIGAEGQYIMGSLAAVVVGISLNLPPIIQVPIIILSGMLAGAVWGAIVGFLKSRFGIHEVITSIMLNWIAFYISNFVAFNDASPFHKFGTNTTYPINESGFTMPFYFWKKSAAGVKTLRSNKALSELMSVDISYGIIIAVVLAFVVSWFLKKTTKGFELRSVGYNPLASKFAGIDVNRSVFRAMMISGAISGLAGVLVVTGVTPHNISNLNVFVNNGFNGMLVALVASSSPTGCILSGVFFSALIYGGRNIQSELNAPSEIINIMIGTIVFFVALTKIIPELVNRHKKKRSTNI